MKHKPCKRISGMGGDDCATHWGRMGPYDDKCDEAKAQEQKAHKPCTCKDHKGDTP